MKSKPWSKLQSRLYNLIDENLNFQIHCIVYPMHSERGSTGLPRYWITLDKNIIWDYPKQFIDKKLKKDGVIKTYPYNTDISEISDLIEEYIQMDKEELFQKHFEKDLWGLANILKSADRRIGIRRLLLLRKKTKNKSALLVIEKRLELIQDIKNKNKRGQ
ncbi:SF0329 family protein [Leptospira interrogans]|uniref:SF0329 family protein n=1 Tax=Leptospira interrogans TaxID=173 RepID=UPI001F11549E|nr:hypothetical protein [Leptospira interrogans]UMQ58095.1 hypothetical protein FH585_18095 [Leptospira interrogans]UNE67839.1 hypothetical protein FH588_06145 [Leptospira interrogans]